MNITENYMNATEEYMQMINMDMDKLCNGDYISIVLGALLIFSEILGMIQKSDCEKNKNDVIDIETEEVIIKRQPTFSENTNGFIHLCYNLISKVKK